MTSRPPHPQSVRSCDSCTFAEKTNSGMYPVKCLISKPVPMKVHEYCIAWFRYVGCASHSSLAVGPVPTPIITDMEGDAVGDCSDCAAYHEGMNDELPCGEAHDKRIAAEERERVLEEMRTACMKDETVGFTVFRIIKSLRREGERR